MKTDGDYTALNNLIDGTGMNYNIKYGEAGDDFINTASIVVTSNSRPSNANNIRRWMSVEYITLNMQEANPITDYAAWKQSMLDAVDSMFVHAPPMA